MSSSRRRQSTKLNRKGRKFRRTGLEGNKKKRKELGRLKR